MNNEAWVSSKSFDIMNVAIVEKEECEFNSNPRL